MREKFGRRIQGRRSTPWYGFDVDFQVESYLHHQGQSFVERGFDAPTPTSTWVGPWITLIPSEDPVWGPEPDVPGRNQLLVSPSIPTGATRPNTPG